MKALPILLLGFALVTCAGTGSAHATLAAPNEADLIVIDGAINPASADFIDSSVARAATDGSAALVIELDTPGGLLSSAREIVKTLLNAPVPVIVYVAPSGAAAASAGTFITQAANIAAMAPGTTIGAAHPVEMGGGNITGTMGEKVENFTVAFARTIARERGRNEAWVEDAVRKSVAINQDQALKQHVIDIVAPDLKSLFTQANGRQVTVAGNRRVTLELSHAEVRRFSMRFGAQVLNRLADPNLMYLLMIAGVLGLYFEFAHPGVFLPGVIGAICLLLALMSFEVIPINAVGLLLMLLGLALLISEVFVTSYGVLGMGGVAAFAIGSLLLIDTSETNLVISRAIIGGAALAVAAFILGIGYLAVRTHGAPATTGREGLIGAVGVVREAIAPGAPGRMFVRGENWRASSATVLAIGAQARVIAVRGLELVVAPLKAQA